MVQEQQLLEDQAPHRHTPLPPTGLALGTREPSLFCWANVIPPINPLDL